MGKKKIKKNKIFLASIIGSLIYAFNPLTFSHYLGHLQLMQKYFLPPLFLFAYKYFKQVNFKNALLFFLFFTLNALSSFYFQIFSIITLFFFSFPWIISNLLNKNYGYFSKLFITSFLFLIFVPILLYFNFPYFEFSMKEGVSRNIEENTYYSARVVDWIIPNINSFIYEKIARNLLPFRGPIEPNGAFNYSEHTMTLNLLPLIILICTIIFFLNKKNKQFKKEAFKSHEFIAYFLIFLASFVFTFGPLLFISSEKTSNIRLPYFYFYEIIPFLKGIRVPSRFEFIFYIPFSLFISVGVYIFLNKIKKGYILLSALIILVIFLENYNPSFTYKSGPLLLSNPNYINTFSNILHDKNTLHLPVYLSDDPAKESRYLNWSTITSEKILNGYSGYFPKDWVFLMQKILLGMDNNRLKELEAIKLDYIIIHKDQINPDYPIEKGLLTQGKIYEDNLIIIIDMNKYNLDKEICSSNKKGLDKKLIQAVTLYKQYYNLIYYKVAIQNTENCYIGNTGFERYSDTTLLIRNKYYRTSVILPLEISPKATVFYSGIIKTQYFSNFFSD